MDFHSLVKNDTYQVFIFACPGNIPFVFATHEWFVLNKKGEISRWEVLFREKLNATSWGHLHKDNFPPFEGIEILPYYRGFLWKPKLLGIIEGDEHSLAKRMIDFIEKSPEIYPYSQKYFLFGPNSNAYPGWVLRHFPDCSIKLPWNAFGKGYK